MKLQLYVEQRSTGNELAGEPVETWERVRREWFDSEPMTGREFVQAQQMNATVTHKFTCPFFAGAHPRMRLTEGHDGPTRIFNVTSVVNEREANRRLVWMAEEVA